MCGSPSEQAFPLPSCTHAAPVAWTPSLIVRVGRTAGVPWRFALELQRIPGAGALEVCIIFGGQLCSSLSVNLRRFAGTGLLCASHYELASLKSSHD